MSSLVGVDLRRIGDTQDDWEEGNPKIMSCEDARAHLNDGHFDALFEFLKGRREYHELLLWVGISMQIGVCISKKHFKYVRGIYDKADPYHLFHFDKQIELAIKEYECGKPYYLKNFDEDGTLLPEL